MKIILLTHQRELDRETNTGVLALEADTASSYRLRRNQPDGGLCTVECIIEILRKHGKDIAADRLESAFIQFNQ